VSAKSLDVRGRTSPDVVRRKRRAGRRRARKETNVKTNQEVTPDTKKPANRSERELADLRAVLKSVRARLMAEPQDRPDVMDAAILDVEMTIDYLADRIDAELAP
jgi:hypothetical protein